MSNPAQPNTRTYTMGQLMIAQNQTYVSLIAAGTPPPAFVSNQNYGAELTGYDEKGWADADAAVDETGLVPYLIYEGTNVITKIHMPLDVAKNYNLRPSGVTYPAYVIAPSKATTSDGSGIPAERLSTIAQAMQIAQIAGSGAPFLDTEGSPVYGAETRRQWAITVNGQTVVVGLALLSQNRAGVGHPGHFNFASPGSEYFVLDPDPTPSTKPSVPVPVRAFLPNESLQQIGFGWLVVRSDIPDPTAAPGAQTDSQAISALSAQLTNVDAKLDIVIAYMESK